MSDINHLGNFQNAETEVGFESYINTTLTYAGCGLIERAFKRDLNHVGEEVELQS